MAAPADKRQNAIPSYVTDYAPILHLYSKEVYNPSDIGTQLIHTTPEVNFTAVGTPPYTLANLDQLNSLGGTAVFLTAKEGIEANPPWFGGIKPDANGVVSNAKTCAIVMVDKPELGNNTVDVFYFYFYAYNLGNSVNILGAIHLGAYGDHVGDWEHNMIRFSNGVPQAVWFSQHSFGEAFTYKVVKKVGNRPVVYVATGSHANYAIPGDHDHTLQVINFPSDGILTDFTDAGPLYDPVASAYFYSYDTKSQAFTSLDSSPTNWLNYNGLWGDQQLPKNAKGQKVLFGNYKYVGGPNGPKFKNLDRHNVCPPGRPCEVKSILVA